MSTSRVSSLHCLLPLTLALALCAARPAAAQQEPKIHDLTETELTEEQLLDALKPTSDPPPELMQTRGLGVAPPRAKCTLYRVPAARGLAVKPPAGIAAIKILFAFNSADLMPDAKRNLDLLGKALSNPSLTTSCFRIEGHTDSIGSDTANDKLSRKRAEAVVQYLASNFRLDPERLMPVGYGKRKPMADNNTDEGRFKNRRVQVANLGFGQPEM
jgi:OOP family OmpA-OmpF porin